MSKRRTLLYILGPSYSGSTLLTFHLAAHPDIATVGELKASAMGDITSYPCSCGYLLPECNFWHQVTREMRHRGMQFSLSNFGTHFSGGRSLFHRLVRATVKHPLVAIPAWLLLKALPWFHQHAKAIVRQNDNLIQIICNLQKGDVFLDASKDPERLEQFRLHGNWCLRAVRLSRDGRGVVNSYMKHKKVGMETAAREWVATEHACDRVGSRLASSSVMRVRYEDLCAAPREVVASILSFAGIDPRAGRQRSAAHEFHILGNTMRLAASKEIRPDAKWQQELTVRELELFERLAGALNRRLGYS